MKRKSPSPFLDSREVDELILKILSRNPFGLSADKIRKDLPPSHRPSKEQITARLEDLLKNGRIHSWHPPGGKTLTPPPPIYSLEPLDRLIQNEILDRLKDQPLTPAQVKKSFPAPVNKYLQIFWGPLLKERAVKWHPPLKGKLLSLKEPDPSDFLTKEIKKLFEKGERLGFIPEAIWHAIRKSVPSLSPPKPPSLTPEEIEEIIFKAMTALKPAAAQGALVYIPDLRRALEDTFPNKESFDQAILDLAKLEKVQLQSHSLPAELTEEHRTVLIDNGRGSYFMAIGIRAE